VAKSRRSSLVKLVVGLAVLAVLAVMFLRSVRSTRAEPFAVERESLTGWTLVVQPPADPLGSWLALRPPSRLATLLGNEIFHRGGESVSYPSPPLVPLLLQSEFERAFAGTVSPEKIESLGRTAAFESTTWAPRCMGYRRISEPGLSAAVYFVLLDAAAFDGFRQDLVELLRTSGGNPSLFDPAALSPVLVVAAVEGTFSRWMPLRADPQADCLAPVDVT
jgi:hypothetical protein